MSSGFFVNIRIDIPEEKEEIIPADGSIKVNYVNGMKEGKATVLSKQKSRVALLSYHHDVLDGLCSFFNESGLKVKDAIYKNGIHNGWGREYNDSEVVFTGIYKNGERYSELIEYEEDKTLWKEMKDGSVLSICSYNDNHKRDGMCYLFNNNELCSTVMMNDDILIREVFHFNKGEFMEYNNDGKLVYRGEYSGSITSGFHRSGKGIEFVYISGRIARINTVENGAVKGYQQVNDTQMSEYDELNRLVYEGGFSGSIEEGLKRNGIGYCYDKGKGIGYVVYKDGEVMNFEREFHDNKMIECDTNGNIVYVGEYHETDDGFHRNGKGVVYEYKDNVLFSEYHYENGEMGVQTRSFTKDEMIEYSPNGICVYQGGFSGCCKDGFVREGKGCEMSTSSVVIYSGEWKHNKREGTGAFYKNGKVMYKGEWKKGKPYGKGGLYNENGDLMYEGDWVNGLYKVEDHFWIDYRDGKKCKIYNNHIIHLKGEWVNGCLNGKGESFNKKDKLLYSGMWKNGKPNGYGSLYHNGKIVYKGEWVDGILDCGPSLKVDAINGCVTHYDDKGVKRYHGEWENGKPHGMGKAYNEEGQAICEGEWEYGVIQLNPHMEYSYRDHSVIVKRKTGKLKYYGEWKSGCPHGHGRYYINNNVVYEGEWNMGRIHVEGNIWFDYNANKEFYRLSFRKPSVERVKKGIKITGGACVIGIVTLLLYFLFALWIPRWKHDYYLSHSDYLTIKSLSEFSRVNRNVRNLTFVKGCCQDVIDELAISHYPLLKELIIGRNSLSNVRKVIFDGTM